MLKRAVLGAASILVAATYCPPAHAQFDAGQALNEYQPAEAGDAFLSVPAPWVGGHRKIRGSLTYDFSKDPLVLVDENGVELATPVSAQHFLHFGASAAMWDRLMISLQFPLAVAQTGDTTDFSDVTVQGGDGAAAGDLRAGLRGRIYGEYDDAIQLGAGAWFFAPTGNDDGYASDGSFYFQPHVLVGGRVPTFVWSGSLGASVRTADNIPSNFNYGIGVAAVLADNALQIGPELFGTVAFTEEDLAAGTATRIERQGVANGELLLSARYRFLESMRVSTGGGFGLFTTAGTPRYRILVQIAYAPEPGDEPAARLDRDGDAVPDDEDACPDTPGVRNEDPSKNGCPAPSDRDGDSIVDTNDACPDTKGVPHDDPDKHGCPAAVADADADGIADADDACVDTPGVPNEDPAKHGCPPDRDGDGIADANDACPDTPGVESDDPKRNGCPPDRDGDGILDADDACPDQHGTKNDDPKKNGCPKVFVSDGKIVIQDKVEFAYDKAVIRKSSDPLLSAVADTLKSNPDIELVEVQGHTDNRGSVFYNRRLSQKRADAVKVALVKLGIDAKRLTTKGYGPAKPLVDNKTEDGRAKNRRVEFLITKRTPK
jgi:OOP family OmpA-OmpF porin